MLSLVRMWRKGNPFALLMGMQTGAASVESSMETPQKIKMDLPFDPVIPLLIIFRKKSKILIRKNISKFKFVVALFTIANIWKQPKCPSVDKTTMGHLHNGVLLGHKKIVYPL